MQRFCHRAGVGIVGWRQSGAADVVATLAQRDNHRRIVTRGRHGRMAAGYTVAGTTITCTVGNAAANGTNAAIIRTIATTTGNAVADGITASIVIGGNTTISCAVGNAVADGVTASILVSAVIACTPGNAVANGVTATIVGSPALLTSQSRSRIGPQALADKTRIGEPAL